VIEEAFEEEVVLEGLGVLAMFPVATLVLVRASLIF